MHLFFKQIKALYFLFQILLNICIIKDSIILEDKKCIL